MILVFPNLVETPWSLNELGPCIRGCREQPDGSLQFTPSDSVLSQHIITIQNGISSINLFIQLITITLTLFRHLTRKGPFFVFILTFAISVLLRIVLSSVALAIAQPKFGILPDAYIILQISLYMDYFSSLFSVTITFFLSLNRCLCFAAEKWNSQIFEGIRVYYCIIFSLFISLLGGIGIIETAKVTRNYSNMLGLLDIGSEVGIKVEINRFFNLFPVGSVICYIILFIYLRKRNKKSSIKSLFAKRGEQKVFAQLVVTAVFYIILNSLYEVAVTLDPSYNDTWVFVQILAMSNYFPEISLSLLFVLDAVEIKKIWSKCFGPVQTTERGPIRLSGKFLDHF